MVMGTASTIACLAEALGMALPGSASPPSGSGDRLRVAVRTGRMAAQMARSRVRPREILTSEAFQNALVVLLALGGSTNAVVHLLAIARRAGVLLTLDDLAALSGKVPLLVDLKPSGAGYMEDFHAAGGMPALLEVLEPLLDGSVRTVAGGPLALVRDGDLVLLDVPAGRVDLLVDEAELSARRASWSPPPLPDRGWLRLHAEHVLQADCGCDLDFC